MSDATGLVQRTERARELFFNQGHVPGDGLAPHISRSWTRSRGAGVWAMEATPLGAAELGERKEASRLLLESAQPELDALAEHAIGHGCVVIVTDAAGVILDEIGSPDFLPKAQRVALLPGVDWSEQRCGTNAIGTVLVERQPLAVLGGEHFLSGHGGLGCAAAPIFTGRGEIAGVLDISGDAIRIDGHTLGLVRMASQQIEHRMMLARAAGDTVRFHANAAVLGSSREGLLTVEDGRVVAANRIALGLLGLSWRAVLDQPVEQLLGRRWHGAGGGTAALTLPGGQRIVLSRQARPSRPARPASPPPPAAAEAPEDAAVARALQQAVKVIDAGVAVLVTGETGAGKEVFARRLHAASRRRAGPLVVVNCAALPDSLIEAELFGYDEGAFTGARRQGTVGRIREAHGGTLMLDEIGDMPLLLQTRLLRVLEDKTVMPLGGGRATPVDFQLVCATHRDLAALAASGRFRADLMFRVNGYEARLPSLRERGDRRALVRRLFAETGGDAKRLTLADEALAALCAFPWPGNVRELLAVLRTLTALADPDTEIGIDMLPARIGEAATGATALLAAHDEVQSQPPPLADLTQQQIRAALHAAGGNVAQAAARLGLHRSTLYRHLRRQQDGR
ncbi:sigma-54-dependent Fis family transcriptional regulator [Variovorax sp. UMC13]|uniref:sigma-54-dependent Fis family transcriptional regulator n=1 Tax=Variovorax sp. UMC13 TaxID=1862326 RepID=UPI0015FF00BC|nr:sigma-54-dependent Fis family transcriptional regulator [Variovorax sp. UMC13]MBB1601398.1 transcriptional activator of acetoin/glycerol metabolism [Variovorax sp. UMC13]